MKRTGQRGFTMLELLVVVGIILVVAAIATPNLIRSVRRYQTEAAARETGNILLRARYAAAQSSQRVSVIYQAPAGGAPAYLGIDFGGDGPPTDDGNGALDAGEPRMALPFGMTSNLGGAPWNVAPDYTAVAAVPAAGLTFSPKGTVVNLVGGTWLTDTQIRGFILQRTIAGGAVTDEYMVVVTPAGRIRMWTRVTPAGPWLPR